MHRDFSVSILPRKINVNYVEDYLPNENIKLNYDKIDKNEGFRSLSKVVLNSFWDKFGQRKNQSKTSVIRDPSELLKIVNNPSLEVNTMEVINKEEVLPNVNIVLAAYTNVQARLKIV